MQNIFDLNELLRLVEKLKAADYLPVDLREDVLNDAVAAFLVRSHTNPIRRAATALLDMKFTDAQQSSAPARGRPRAR